MPVVTESKSKIAALEEAKNKLHTEKILYNIEEVISGLFKTTSYKVTAISYQELLNEIETYLKDILEKLDIEVSFEILENEDNYEIVMSSSNNSLLIGKDGKNLKALEQLVRAYVSNNWNNSLKIILNVENYREKRIQVLERLAIKVAKEVRNTKVDVELENMNSFERRIIHNKLVNFKGVSTVSVGEEPNRHIVIKGAVMK